MSNLRRGSVQTRVHNLVREATNLKTSQFTGWDSVRCYKIETSREWDFSYTPTFVGGQTQEGIDFFIKFTADHQDAPFATPTIDILIDNQYKYRVGGLDNNGSDLNADNGVYTNGWVPDNFGNYSPTGLPNAKNEKSWYNALTVFGQFNIKVKIRVYATDTGRIMGKYEHNDGTGFFIT